MRTSRIRLGHEPGQIPPNSFSDFAWVRQHEAELLKKHGACIILVYQEQIIGKGATLEAALEDAERSLPPDISEVTPILTTLYDRKSFMHVRPKPLLKGQ